MHLRVGSGKVNYDLWTENFEAIEGKTHQECETGQK